MGRNCGAPRCRCSSACSRSLTAIVSAVGIAALFGASHQTIASLAPKSATIAMAVAAEIGGIPSLTAVLTAFVVPILLPMLSRWV
ncbi:hypothetical protein VL15_20200 [Burkholderia cepacia]|uniref:Uncharacterized protein n=1 Tax=Burkholderia cepacia TaxID=292 RepID=A0A0J5WJF1_BURCE|nr:hypothetical protein VL15_20200 [Burkholderia cepacia]